MSQLKKKGLPTFGTAQERKDRLKKANGTHYELHDYLIGIQVSSNRVDAAMGAGIDKFEAPKATPQGGYGGVPSDLMPQQPKLVKKSSVVDKV